MCVLSQIRGVAGFCFYLLGSGIFLAYLLVRNDIQPEWSLWWMHVTDLPLAASMLTYAGLSLYTSLVQPGKRAYGAALVIGLPLVAIFLLVVTLNFWEILGLPIAG